MVYWPGGGYINADRKFALVVRTRFDTLGHILHGRNRAADSLSVAEARRVGGPHSRSCCGRLHSTYVFLFCGAHRGRRFAAPRLGVAFVRGRWAPGFRRSFFVFRFAPPAHGGIVHRLCGADTH